MKRLAFLFALVVTAYAASDIHLFRWQELRDAKSGEKQFGFFIAPQAVQAFLEAQACGDQKGAEVLGSKLPKDTWDYGVLLRGESKTYQKEEITLFEPSPCGDLPEVVSGMVEVDWKKQTVRIALKVVKEGKVVDFVGNGTYSIEKAPNQAAQATPGSSAAPRV